MKKLIISFFVCLNLGLGVTKAQVPALVKDIKPGSHSGSFPTRLTDVNGTLFFVADDDVHGNELWKSDGTETGTVMVKDILPPDSYATYDYLTDVAGTLFFTVDDGIHGKELWKSDGTEAGTLMVKDINPNTYNPNPPGNFIVIGNTLYFTANDGTHGNELWKSDGTAAGTTMVVDLYPGPYSGFYGGGYDYESREQTSLYLANLNGTLYFLADNGNNLRGLWKSDGTAVGTTFVKGIEDYGAYLSGTNDALYFIGGDFGQTFGGELWKSDGTTAGTAMIKDINQGTGSSKSTSHNYAGGSLRVFAVGNTVYFAADSDGDSKEELWKTDGTEAGTVLVKNINSGYPILYCTNIDNTLFFAAFDGSDNYGYELWKSDGTETGTVMVKDIYPGTSSSSPRFLVNYNGLLYFNAFNNEKGYGQTLWESDGTEAGTVAFTPYNNFTGARDLTISNGRLYFVGDAKDDSGTYTGSELYYLDLTSLINGVSDITKNVTLNIYPNPTNSVLNVEAKENTNITIVNMLGAAVVTQKLSEGNNSINVSDLTNGVYFISNDKGGVAKFVKE